MTGGIAVGLKKDLGNFTDEMTAGEWVTARIGGER